MDQPVLPAPSSEGIISLKTGLPISKQAKRVEFPTGSSRCFTSTWTGSLNSRRSPSIGNLRNCAHYFCGDVTTTGLLGFRGPVLCGRRESDRSRHGTVLPYRSSRQAMI